MGLWPKPFSSSSSRSAAGRSAGVAVVESDNLKAPVDQCGAEIAVPVQYVGADALEQQQRFVGAAEALVGDLDAVVGGGKLSHAASIIGKMLKAARLGLCWD
ncbi:hypothetical protein [Mycobacterium lentiflavum]|uniref:hypothetical protein n=1 Tax=Mycobacterium lentiflavum TaxID=141349 RepID=UPI0011128D3B|nr:hypothetical protein [Mycobacterium lentiflavum]